MDAGTSPAPQVRVHHRHELRSLAYLTLDQGNGGIIRNLTAHGLGAQLMAPVRPGQQLQMRFELRSPRLQVETRGEVVWATFSGQCGIRFLDSPPRTTQQIHEWILGNLLERVWLHAESESIFAAPAFAQSDLADVCGDSADARDGQDGLMVSATPVKVIELPIRRQTPLPAPSHVPQIAAQDESELDWLSQPLSGRGLAWTIDALVVLAGMLLVALVFLSVTREAPRWPLAMAAADALFVAGLYWGFSKIFGGMSFGTRLARLAESDQKNEMPIRGARFH